MSYVCQHCGDYYGSDSFGCHCDICGQELTDDCPECHKELAHKQLPPSNLLDSRPSGHPGPQEEPGPSWDNIIRDIEGREG